MSNQTTVRTTSVEVENRNRKNSRPTYIKDMYSKWVKWTEIDDDEIAEGLDYMSGDLYFEMRKLTSRACQQNERALSEMAKKLDKYFNDREKLREVFEIINLEMEGLKKGTKGLIDASWRDIVDKQKVGLDKVCIVIVRDRTELIKSLTSKQDDEKKEESIQEDKKE